MCKASINNHYLHQGGYVLSLFVVWLVGFSVGLYKMANIAFALDLIIRCIKGDGNYLAWCRLRELLGLGRDTVYALLNTIVVFIIDYSFSSECKGSRI